VKQFDGLTWLTLTRVFYDRSTPVAAFELSVFWTLIRNVFYIR